MMNAGGAVDLTEQIKWWDVQDGLIWASSDQELDARVQVARDCQHVDARWLASLFPDAGVAVTRQRMHEVMLEQGEDPRALYLSARLGGTRDDELLRRAAAMGYAPAQFMASHTLDDDEERLRLVQRSYAQGDRDAACYLALLCQKGQGCAQDERKGNALMREAAELDSSDAQYYVGLHQYRKHDWERFYWWGRAGARRFSFFFCSSAIELSESFEKGELGRVLHTIVACLRVHLDVAGQKVFGYMQTAEQCRALERMIELQNAVDNRARLAIACWSMVGRRLRVVKDVRVMISKMLWVESWCWSQGSKAPRRR
jgi:TPR repeat protein